jgi:hypothetical protein
MSKEGGTGDRITAPQEPEGIKPNGTYRIFWAVVQGSKGGDGSNFNTNYTLTIGGDTDVVDGDITDDTSRGEGGKKVTFKNDSTISEKHITVTATAAGKADATVTWTIWVDVNAIVSTGPDFENAQWVIKNTVVDRGRAIDADTTTALEVKNGRYEVFNNEPGATIDAQPVLGGNAFRDVTIMYLNVPIPADSEGFTPFGIQARIRVTGHRTTPPVFGATNDESWGSGRQALVMGYINDPTASDFGQTFESAEAEAATTTPDKAPFFHGFRILSSGQHRFYGRRPGTGGYGSAQLTPTPSSNDVNEDIPGTTTKYQAQLEMHDYVNGSLVLNTQKKEGFMDQEYVVKVVRSGTSMHYFEVYDSSGENMLFSCHPSGGSNYPGIEMTGVSNYLAFLVYGVKAEISDIKVFYDDQQVWEDSAVKDATPLPKTAKRVDITVNNGTKVQLAGDTENDYSIAGDKFPSDGVPIAAEVVPLTLPAASKVVDWTVTGSGSLIFSGGAIWQDTPVVYGKNTVTATARGSSVSSTVKFWAKDPADIVDPGTVTINTPSKTSLNDGEKLTLTATVGPVGAEQEVTWSITMSDGTSPVDKKVAFIQPKTGELRAFTAKDAAVTINVYATAAGTTIKSAAQTMTINKSTGVYRVWRFGAGSLTYDEGAEGDVIGAGTPWVDSGSGNVNNKNLTLPGGLTLTADSTAGARWDSTQAWPAAWNGGLPNASDNKGVYNPNWGGETNPFFEIMDFGLPVKVTVVWSHTGNTLAPNQSATPNPAYDRQMYAIYGSGAKKWNPVLSSMNGIATSILQVGGVWTANQDSTYANAVWTTESGSGKVAVYGVNLNPEPGSNPERGKPEDIVNQAAAGVRIMEIRVEPGEGGPGPWTPTTTTTWTFGNDVTEFAAGGWEAYASPDNKTNNTDLSIIKGGMTLKINASTRAMRWVPGQSVASTWTGCVQTTGDMDSGNGILHFDGGVKGPFRVTVRYSGTGGGQSGRYGDLLVNSVKTEGPEINIPTGGSASALTVTYTYDGDQTVPVIFLRRGGDMRVYGVVIEK